jgi:hypothetical protein
VSRAGRKPRAAVPEIAVLCRYPDFARPRYAPIGFFNCNWRNETMSIKMKIVVAWITLSAAILMTSNAVAEEHLKKHIRGSLKNDVYTNPGRDFRVHVPVYEATGGAGRDESGKRGDMEVAQVIFTDDFGRFYRIVSMKTTRSMDDVINVFQDVRDKQILQTARGREIRVIDVEKEGAEMTVTTIENGGAPKVQKPDMVTANAVFAANGRVYHLTAGFPVFQNRTVEEVAERMRKDLDELLAGFEVLDGDKRAK